MKRILYAVAFVLMPTLTGCTVSEALFSVFGDHYSGGGLTREEKQYHYKQQVEASQNHDSSLQSSSMR